MRSRTFLLIVVSTLEQSNPIALDQVDNSVCFRHPARPSIRHLILERFRLSDAAKGVRGDRIDKLENPERECTVGLHPPAEIIKEACGDDE
jgi:hypothetical protein